GTQTEAELSVLAQSVIQDLIEQKVLLQEAEALGIEISDEEIARYVLQFDGFKDSDGRFSAKLYERSLKRLGLSRGRFEDKIRRELTLNRLLGLAQGAVHVTDSAVAHQYRIENTSMSLTWIEVPDAAFLDDVPVEDTAIDAFLSVERDKVEAEYQADFERLYNVPAKATVRAILLRNDLGETSPEDLRARMDDILDQATSGENFADLALRHSEDLSAGNGGLLGTLNESQMDPPVARAVLAAGAGAITEVVETGRGLQILKVEELTEGRVTALEDVERKIARDLVAAAQVSEHAGRYAEDVLASWKASGAPPIELLDTQSIEAQTTPQFGLTQAPPEIRQNAGLMAALQSVESATIIDGVFPTESGRVIAAVDSYTPADESGLETQRNSLHGRLTLEARSQFLDHWRRDLVRKANVAQYYTP
ncbi:MAG: SurA N-terminal domain-containing protein, partial [Myxococcota bacterium]|nr:SurA N-terminal domain-containing protein [Myxococcota bacterium]